MWDYMRRQVAARPELALGGPSLGWLKAALAECHALSLAPAPDVPTLTALGTAEKVVDTAPIHLRMANWRGGVLDLYNGAEHEIMMETEAHRTRFFDTTAALFDAHP
jgi:lysophospholipase